MVFVRSVSGGIISPVQQTLEVFQLVLHAHQVNLQVIMQLPVLYAHLVHITQVGVLLVYTAPLATIAPTQVLQSPVQSAAIQGHFVILVLVACPPYAQQATIVLIQLQKTVPQLAIILAQELLPQYSVQPVHP